MAFVCTLFKIIFKLYKTNISSARDNLRYLLLLMYENECDSLSVCFQASLITGIKLLYFFLFPLERNKTVML